jgi:hypothetical protein
MVHPYETITDTMNIVRTQKKGKHLKTLEKYHIYKISKNNLHTNDTNIDTHNPIFRTLQQINTSQQQPHPSSYIKQNQLHETFRTAAQSTKENPIHQ